MKFKCIYTGQVYEFVQEHDIKAMKEHPEYREVIEEQVEETIKQPVRGRPAKQANKEE